MKNSSLVFLLLGGTALACVSPANIDTGDSTGGDVESGSGGSGSGGSVAVEETGGRAGRASGGAESVEPRPSTGGEGDGGAANENICPFGDEIEYNPEAAYPYCQPIGPDDVRPLSSPFDISRSNYTEALAKRCRFSSYFEGSLGGEGYGVLEFSSLEGSPDGAALDYCTCAELCAEVSECSTPETGSAEPSCIDNSCLLTCDEGESCPDGMACALSEGNGRRVCAWGSRGEACDTSEWPDVSPGDERPDGEFPWPELPTERGTISDLMPGDISESGCCSRVPGEGEASEEYCPIGIETRGVLDVLPSEAVQGLNIFGETDSQGLGIGVYTEVGVRMGAMVTELAPPEGIIDFGPVYWIGSDGDFPYNNVGPNLAGVLLKLIPKNYDWTVVDPNGPSLHVYYSADGVEYEQLEDGTVGLGSGTLPAPGFVVLGAEMHSVVCQLSMTTPEEPMMMPEE